MPINKIKKFLDEHRVKYIVVTHSPAYTSQEVAASAHVSGREMAKTVVVELDGRKALAVLPANQKIVLHDLREVTGAEDVKLVPELEFKGLFPDCEIGAMPPFGNLYGLEVYISPALTENTEIAFNAGSHTDLIRMRYADFDRLVQPRVMIFTT